MFSFRAWQKEQNCRKIPWKYSLSRLHILHNYGLNGPAKSQCKEGETTTSSSNKCVAINSCGIQMLPRSIHRQIFEKENTDSVSKETLLKIEQHLSTHHLFGKSASILPDIDFKLPTLLGKNIAEHFEKIAEKQCGGYRDKLLDLTSHCIPDIPQVWNFTPGWTRYNQNGETSLVDFPEEDAYVFDVEVCVKEGHLPTLATAVSKNYWYSWCSNQLFTENKVQSSILKNMGSTYELKDLINLESKKEQDRLHHKDQKERIVIGHNVSYDRSRIKEQYFIEGTKVRFLDTMALHIAISGITSFQRNMLLATKSGTGVDRAQKNPQQYWSGKSRKTEEILEWQNVSSFNGLNDVYKLYCGGLGLDKEKRNVFVTGSLTEIKDDFQQLVTYCARDCQATYRILCVLLPEYQRRFPHPVTLAGMLEMSTAYLPVNRNWQRYLQDSEDTYRDLENELTQSLKREADRATHMMTDKSYERDPWLWDLDWSTKPLKVKKKPTSKKKKCAFVIASIGNGEPIDKINDEEEDSEILELKKLRCQFQELFDTKQQLFKRNSFLPGYPNWYTSLCDRLQDGLIGPSEVSTSAQVVPKLLKLTWDGYPLFYSRELGWGYLVPGRPLKLSQHHENVCETPFPLKDALARFPPRSADQSVLSQGIITAEEAMLMLNQMTDLTADPVDLAMQWQATRSSLNNNVDQTDLHSSADKSQKKHTYYLTSDRPAWHVGIGPYDVGVVGCWFFRLPHKSGIDNNVGNPLAKDYLNKIEDGTLKATSSSIAEHILKLNRNIIYWRNARDRIMSQMVVWLKQSQMSRNVTKSDHFDPLNMYGAILPQIVTSGTLTRRAVESTWLTASNAYKDRIGSELKAMVQCPPGFSFVGADVDSQELWIASIIGDSYFAGQHGATAFGWMTLQGKKSDGTDMHSRTAAAVEITRDQAKILNYGRIYGAGERFAKTLLMQFNHRLTEKEATEKARKMYSMTKGNSVFKLSYCGRQLATALGNSNELATPEQLNEMRKSARKDSSLKRLANLPTDELVERRMWDGGTESHMFNKLEEIAQSESPQTPVLHCRISRALEPRNVGNEFMTSRVNWVVQSSAVDYLHLMIVAMRYLVDVYKIEGRFSISIHDEVRYMIKEEDKFRAALALQVANLWTRCMFSYQMNLNDLPQAVAFFSSVDIDTVLRKETNMDCQTPSNPYGLKQGYGIDFGCSYDIYQILEKTGGSLDSIVKNCNKESGNKP